MSTVARRRPAGGRNPIVVAQVTAASFLAKCAAYWKLDSSGWADSTAHSNTLAASGPGATLVAGKVGNGASLDGVDCLFRASAASLVASNALSAGGWAKNLGTEMPLLCKSDDTSNNGWLITTSGDGADLMFFAGNAGTEWSAVASGVLNDTDWMHIAFVLDMSQAGNANRFKMWLNGSPLVLAFPGNPVAAIHDTGSGLAIGQDDSGLVATAVFDEWWMMLQAATAADIVWHNNRGAGRSV
jgi:hypothetical protein